MQFLVQRIEDLKKMQKKYKKSMDELRKQAAIHPAKNDMFLCSIEPKTCVLHCQQNAGPGSMARLGIP